MTIVLLGLAFISYVGARWYLSQPLTDANGNQQKMPMENYFTIDEITESEGCTDGQCSQQQTAPAAAGQPEQQQEAMPGAM